MDIDLKEVNINQNFKKIDIDIIESSIPVFVGHNFKYTFINGIDVQQCVYISNLRVDDKCVLVKEALESYPGERGSPK